MDHRLQGDQHMLGVSAFITELDRECTNCGANRLYGFGASGGGFLYRDSQSFTMIQTRNWNVQSQWRYWRSVH